MSIMKLLKPFEVSFSLPTYLSGGQREPLVILRMKDETKASNVLFIFPQNRNFEMCCLSIELGRSVSQILPAEKNAFVFSYFSLRS